MTYAIETAAALVTTRGTPLEKAVPAVNERGKGQIVGLSPWRGQAGVYPWNLNGAVVKAQKWNEYFSMYSTHAIVRAAIDKISKSATNTGFDIVPRDSRSEPNEAEVEKIKNFFQGQHDFASELRMAYKHLLISGDAYLYIVPDLLRRPVQLRTLHPKTMHIRIDGRGKILGYVQKNLDDIDDENDIVEFEPHEIIHIKIDNPDDDIYGLSPLESLKWAIGTDFYAQRYNASFFANSGVTGTIIGVRNADSAEVERNRRWIEENYTGPESAHKPVILEGESISISKAVATHTEMGFLAGREFIIQEILAVLDMPPAKLGRMESANRSNSAEQDKTFRTESIAPLQGIFEAAINGQFIWPILGTTETKFVHSDSDSRDQIEQMDLFVKAEAYGIMSPNEARGKLGMAPVDGGEINFVMTPTGAVPLDRMNLYFQLPQPNTDKIPSVGSDPPSGEPTPKDSPQTKTVTVSKTLGDGMENLKGAMVLLKSSQPADLTQAYSYLNDASHVGPEVEEAVGLLRKALTSDDPLLSHGYMTRVANLLQPYNRFFEGDSDDDG